MEPALAGIISLLHINFPLCWILSRPSLSLFPTWCQWCHRFFALRLLLFMTLTYMASGVSFSRKAKKIRASGTNGKKEGNHCINLGARCRPRNCTLTTNLEIPVYRCFTYYTIEDKFLIWTIGKLRYKRQGRGSDMSDSQFLYGAPEPVKILAHSPGFLG